MDGCRMEVGQKLDISRMEVKQNSDKPRTKVEWMSNGRPTKVERTLNKMIEWNDRMAERINKMTKRQNVH
jgi:hypothetical protein